MVAVFFLRVFGWWVAHTPIPLLQATCWVVGLLIYAAPRWRRTMLANLAHAFPEKTEEWRRAIAREHARRLVETGLFALSSPFWSDARLARRFTLPSDPTLSPYQFAGVSASGGVMSIPHLTLMEMMALHRHLMPPGVRFGDIYRPLDHPGLNRFLLETRSRHGAKFFDRKRELFKAMDFAGAGGWLSVPFDQNAGPSGALTFFFDRLCSTTELPGLIVERHRLRLIAAWPHRLGFWRAELRCVALPHDGTHAGVAEAQIRWLEAYLRSGDEACADWLWSHRRWQTQDPPRQRLRLSQKRDFTAAQLALRGSSQWPRRTPFFVRLPNWLGDVVMALPLLRALRRSRPDVQLTLVGKAAFAPLLEAWAIGDRYLPLPGAKATLGYWWAVRRWRRLYPATALLFTNSVRGDLEAWLTGAPQRFGLERPRRRRPLLSHRWPVPPTLDEATLHQTALWQQWLEHFGLAEPPDTHPLGWPGASPAPTPTVGLICGTENFPAKRWPVEHWRALVQGLAAAQVPGLAVDLFGTPNDAAITAQVVAGAPAGLVLRDRAGKTTLPEFAAGLAACRVVVCNDTGGMHLANAIGVPVVGLFGPTNPVRTGPIFTAPKTLLQPLGCPPTGGAALAELPPATVLAATLPYLR